MAVRYRCLHSLGFQVMLINVTIGQNTIECGVIRFPAGIGDRTPWLFDFDTGDRICRAAIPEEDQGPTGPIVYHSQNDDLALDIYR